MKKLIFLIIVLGLNLVIFATYDSYENDAEKTYLLCKGFTPKSYTHLSLDFKPLETVDCCVRSQESKWCDFANESPLCAEHLKMRVKDLCVEVTTKGDDMEEEVMEEGVSEYYQ